MFVRLSATLVILAALTATAGADSHVVVSDAWSRATAPNQKNGAVFLTIDNAGGSADRVVGAASPHAERVELHNHLMDGGVMKMRPVKAVEVPADGAVEFKPGSYHIMLMGLTERLAEGDVVPLTMTFEHAGTIEIQARILGAGASGAYAPRDGGDGPGSHGGAHDGSHDSDRKDGGSHGGTQPGRGE